MSTTRWEQVQALFEAALGRPAEEREAFLRKRCGDDKTLLSEVAELLEADAESTSFMQNLLDVSLLEGEALRPGEQAGPYRIERRLGRGAMGVVYAAIDTRLERPVALKFLSRDLHGIEQLRLRFLQEARAASKLDHPHICTIYDIGATASGEMFIAMALCEGEDLARTLASGPLKLQRALTITTQLADALAAAHARGIVHRDLKPGNVIVGEQGVKVVDFGIAKVAGVDITGEGIRLGTLAYMSPQQLNGEPVDARADIWSLGVMLYEMLCGAKPFRGDTAEALLREVLNADARAPSEIVADLPPALDVIVARALERDLDRRYQSMRDLHADLSRIVGHGAAVSPAGPDDAAAERRQVTVLHCALVPVRASADPEALLDILPRFRELAGKVVARFEGVVSGASGDSIVAYFGVPLAHEDDARRAVRAGLGSIDALSALTEAAGAGLRARAGVHTGTMVARGTQGTVTIDPAALVGTVPRATAALESLAAPGELLVSETTHALLAGQFSTRAHGAHALPGEVRSLAAHVVLRESTARRRLAEQRAPAPTPLVGREQEVAMLRQRWEMALEGQGQCMVIAGDAGIGKSRLVQVLREFAAAASNAWLTECQCSPYQRNTALYPVIDLLERVVLQFAPNDTVEQRLQRLEGFLLEYGHRVDEAAPFLGSLLGLPLAGRYPPLQLSPERARQRTLELLIDMLLERAARQPVLFIAEDLHWADATFLELIDHLVDQVPAAPILAVFTQRAEFDHAWSTRAHLGHLSLPRLSNRQVRALIGTLPGASALREEQVDNLVAHADGVPLYAEELAKSVVESDAVSPTDATPIPIPATLQESLTARLDRLGAVKSLAQLASLLGREFTYPLLAAVAGRDDEQLQRDLDKLVGAELLFRRGIAPNVSFIFKHALIQEAAYQSLLLRDRERQHGHIAATLQAHFAELCEAQPQLPAHHLAGAGQFAEAIGWWIKAGTQAQRRSANKEALGHFSEALQALEHIAAGAERDGLELSVRAAMGPALMAIKGYAAEEVESTYRRALTLSQQLGDTPRQVPVLFGLWAYYVVRGELATARELGEQLLRLARAADNSDLLLEAYTLLGVTLFHSGDIAGAREYLESGIAVYDPKAHGGHAYIYGQDPGMACRSYLASVLWWQGLADEARAMSESALTLARELGHAHSLAFALYIASRLRFQLRDYGGVIACTDECIALSAEYGFPIWQTLGTMMRGRALVATGEVEQGIAMVDKALGLYRARGAGLSLPYYLGLHAGALAVSGRAEEGMAAIEQALADADRFGAHTERAELLRIRAELWRRYGEREKALQGFRDAFELAGAQGARAFALRAALSLAELLREDGEAAQARTLLAPVYATFDEGLDTPDLQAAKVLLEGD